MKTIKERFEQYIFYQTELFYWPEITKHGLNKIIMVHALKTWPEYCKLIESGKKTFELRKDDRPFEQGDDIILQEYDPKKKEYSGKEWHFIAGYIYRGTEFGLKRGYCILSLLTIKTEDY